MIPQPKKLLPVDDYAYLMNGLGYLATSIRQIMVDWFATKRTNMLKRIRVRVVKGHLKTLETLHAIFLKFTKSSMPN